MVIFSWKLFFNCLNYSLVSLFCVYFDLFHTINDTGSHILLKNYFPLFYVLSIKIGFILPPSFYRVPFHSFLPIGMLFWSQSSRGMPFGSQLTCIYFHNWLDSIFLHLTCLYYEYSIRIFVFFIFRYLPPSTIFMRCEYFLSFCSITPPIRLWYLSHPFYFFTTHPIEKLLFLFIVDFPTSQIFSWSIWGRSPLSCNADFSVC